VGCGQPMVFLWQRLLAFGISSRLFLASWNK
jgi:hypothetical protein